MPGQPSVAADEEEKQLMENTMKNINAGESSGSSTAATVDGSGNDDLLKRIEEYKTLIEEWKDELAKAKKDNEILQKDNQRLKDENSALLRVVGSLSGTGRK